MPRKPRSPRKKFKRKFKDTHIENMIALRDELFAYHLFCLGESDSATEQAYRANAMAMSIQELIDLLENHLINNM